MFKQVLFVALATLIFSNTAIAQSEKYEKRRIQANKLVTASTVLWASSFALPTISMGFSIKIILDEKESGIFNLSTCHGIEVGGLIISLSAVITLGITNVTLNKLYGELIIERTPYMASLATSAWFAYGMSFAMYSFSVGARLLSPKDDLIFTLGASAFLIFGALGGILFMIDNYRMLNQINRYLKIYGKNSTAQQSSHFSMTPYFSPNPNGMTAGIAGTF